MKRTYKKLWTTAAIVLSPIAVSAISPQPVTSVGNLQGETMKKVFKPKTSESSRMSAPVVEYLCPPKTIMKAASEEDMNPLTVTIVGDAEMYTVIGVRVKGIDYSDNMWLDLGDEEAATGTVDLTSGLYTIVAHFRKIDPAFMFSHGADVFVVEENIDMSSPQQIILDVATATNKISGISYTPDGSVPKLPTKHYTADGLVEEEGNVNYMIISTDISQKNLGFVYGSIIEADFSIINDNGGVGFEIFKRAELWINDVSEDIEISQWHLSSSDDNGFYYSEMQPIYGVHESVEAYFDKNFSEPYVTDYSSSVIGKESEENGFEPIYTCVANQIFENINLSKTSGMSSSSKLWRSGISSDDTTYDMGLSVWYGDYQEIAYDDEDPEIELGTMVYFTRTMPLQFKGNADITTIFLPLNSEYGQNENGDVAPQLGSAFEFNLDDCRQQLGDSQASISFLSYLGYDWEEEDYLWYVTPVPYGRRGELRASDLVAMRATEERTEKDGHEIFTYTVIDDNQIVDGIQGLTTASFSLDTDQTLYPPVLRQLQFRTNEGVVTDRFDTFSQGTFLLSAATYNQQLNPEEVWNWWYDVEPCNVKVSVSPYSEQDWTEVDLEELEGDYVPAFGHVYSGAFDKLSSSSSNGWFDIKIELEAMNGAVSSQVISPAFKVADATTGIKEVANVADRVIINGQTAIAAGNDVLLEIFSLDGKALLSGNGMLNFSNLPKGIYLLTATGDGNRYSCKISR